MTALAVEDLCLQLDQGLLAALYQAPVFCSVKPIADYSVELGEQENHATPRMALSRRDEFSTGRHCAHQALLAANAGLPRDIAMGRDREPCWPNGIRGSISHTKELAAAVVADASGGRSLGLDIERQQVLEPGVTSIIAGEEELRNISVFLWQSLQNNPGWQSGNNTVTSLPQLAACLAFSAKESIYKCLFPVHREWLDFKQVSIELLELASDDSKSLCSSHEGLLIGAYAASLTDGYASAIDMALLSGRFLLYRGMIITATELIPESQGAGAK